MNKRDEESQIKAAVVGFILLAILLIPAATNYVINQIVSDYIESDGMRF